MTIYVGMTQDLKAARAYLSEQKKGMYPDVEMGPFEDKVDAINYIKYMQNKFPGCVEVDLPDFSSGSDVSDKWWVFSFEHSGVVH